MLKPRSELESFIRKQCETVCLNRKNVKAASAVMQEKHNFSIGDATNLLSLRSSLENQTEFVLFCILEALAEVSKTVHVNEWFTTKEIKTYSKTRMEEDELEFPLSIKCYRVAPDQYCGVADVKFLMALRKAQLINYNINAQRTMKRIIRGGTESYQIALNKNAVSQIRSALESDTYIPNVMTLNIPVVEESDFYYSEKDAELVIRKLNHFDMTDGYHRYIAMCQASDANPDFNYPIELRIVNFSDDKAKQFIFQEDQKTKMKKVQSDSMNMNAPANIVTERLNQDVLFNLNGKINRNNGFIDFSYFSYIISVLFFKDVPKESYATERIKVQKLIRDGFNLITEEDTSYLEKKYNYAELVVCLLAIKEYGIKKGITNAITKVIETVNTDDELKKVLDPNRKLSTPTIKKISSLLEKGVSK